MQIFFAVLSAILAAKLAEWVIVAAVKTYQEQKKKSEAFDKITKAK